MRNKKLVMIFALLVSLFAFQAKAFADTSVPFSIVLTPANGSTVTLGSDQSLPVSFAVTPDAGVTTTSSSSSLWLDNVWQPMDNLTVSGGCYSGVLDGVTAGQHTLDYRTYLDYSVAGRVYATTVDTVNTFTALAAGNASVVAPDAEQETALDYINSYRSGCRLPPLRLNDSLDAAAQAHSVYMQDNNRMVHDEIQGNPGFTAVDPYRRDEYFGYGSQYDYEDIFEGAPNVQAAIDSWIDVVYHRIPMLDPAAVNLGYGHAGIYYTIDIGFSGYSVEPGAGNSNVSVYPYDGMTNTPTTFPGCETPDPLDQFNASTAGFPISFEAGNTDKDITNVSATLTSNGTDIPVYVLTPSTDTTGDLTDSVFLLPKNPLAAGTEYTATVSCTADGNSYSKTWSFTTGSVPSGPSGGTTTTATATGGGGGGGGGGAALTAAAPTVQTVSSGSVTSDSASLVGDIVTENGSDITGYGFLWGTKPDALINTRDADSNSELESGTYTADLTGLTAGTTYYYEAYATNADGMGTGAVMSFTTSSANPVIPPTVIAPAPVTPTGLGITVPGDLQGSWARTQATALLDKGIINGYPDGTFRPSARVTRAEFAVMLVKALGLTGSDSGKFADVAADAWYSGAVSAAASHGLIAGVSVSRFAPNAPITREQIAVMMDNAMSVAGISTTHGDLIGYSDESTVAPWAAPGISACIGAGLMNGMGDGTLTPQGDATRAQAAVMIYNLLVKAKKI